MQLSNETWCYRNCYHMVLWYYNHLWYSLVKYNLYLLSTDHMIKIHLDNNNKQQEQQQQNLTCWVFELNTRSLNLNLLHIISNGLALLQFLKLSIINFGDIKIRIWSWTVKYICTLFRLHAKNAGWFGSILVAKANQFQGLILYSLIIFLTKIK